MLRQDCDQDVPFEAYTFAEDLRTLQAAIKWPTKHLQVQLLAGECLTNWRSLYILGYPRPTRGVACRVKRLCEPDPRAHLQQIFIQSSARKCKFDFHINPPLFSFSPHVG